MEVELEIHFGAQVIVPGFEKVEILTQESTRVLRKLHEGNMVDLALYVVLEPTSLVASLFTFSVVLVRCALHCQTLVSPISVLMVVKSHEYYNSNTCVNLCEIRLHYRFNDKRSISPKVLSLKNFWKTYDDMMYLAEHRGLVRE